MIPLFGNHKRVNGRIAVSAWGALLLGALVTAFYLALLPTGARAQECIYWVAPAPMGSDANPGTAEQPWATLAHAAAHAADEHCTIWVNDGVYSGPNNLSERFATPTTFKAVNPYQAVLENNGPVLKLSGVRNMTFDGFIFRHAGTDVTKHVVIADRSGEGWAEHLTLRNNIFQDSLNNDLLKVHNGVRFATIEGNVFYNQGDKEQHIDVNSVTDVVVQDNIFFNDFAGSGMTNTNTTKHFIIIKDSNEGEDGLEGSERITVRRNIFMNWEGGVEHFVKAGNDGKPYHEAKDVVLENNLMIGNTSNPIGAAFGVRGARDITFTHNTVVGDLPAKAYAYEAKISELNPPNENVVFYNNIWADSTGTMGIEVANSPQFADGDAVETKNLVLDNNLYWNGGAEIPAGTPLSPLIDDVHRVVADPLLETDHLGILLPRWNGTTFLSGNRFIREEFERLIAAYGQIPAASPAIAAANPAFAPATDILGRPRTATPDLGAFEYTMVLSGTSELDTIRLHWTDPREPAATSLSITYTTGISPVLISGIPTTTRAYTLTDLAPAVYTVTLSARAGDGSILATSNTIALRAGGVDNQPPVVDAGIDEAIILPLSATLNGTVSDDGLPVPPGAITTQWDQVSGPCPVTFLDPNSVDTIVSFCAMGVFVLRLTVSDGALSASDDVTITVIEETDEAAAIAVRVDDSADDVEEVGTGEVDIDSPTLSLVMDQGNEQIVGLRFNDIDIEQGATIDDAYLQFQSSGGDTAPATLRIQGEAADNAARFLDETENISSRFRTSADVTWSPPPWLVEEEAGSDQRTPNLALVIQEIIDRPGWVSGNALVLIISGNGSRIAASYDGEPAGAPLLHIEYTEAGPNASEQQLTPIYLPMLRNAAP